MSRDVEVPFTPLEVIKALFKTYPERFRDYEDAERNVLYRGIGHTQTATYVLVLDQSQPT